MEQRVLPGSQPDSLVAATGIERWGIAIPRPVDHEIPLFQAINNIPGVDLTVLYFSKEGVARINEYGVTFDYGFDVLEGYRHAFLENVSPFRSGRLKYIVRGLGKFLAGARFDRVVLYGYNSPAALYVIWYCNRKRIPVYLRCEGESVQPVSLIKRALREFVLPTLFSKFDGFLALCEANAKHYAKYGVTRDKIFLVPQTVLSEQFASPANGRYAALRRKYRIPNDRTVFILCSKLRREKSPLDAIRAFCGVSPTASCHLLVLSDGPLREECEKLVTRKNCRDRVSFAGYVPFDEMVVLMNLADVLVMSSSETIGAALYQGISCGLAIVTSDMVPGWLDVVRPGWNGLVYRYGWCDALTKCLESLATNNALVAEMKLNSRELSKSYLPDRTAVKFAAALRREAMSYGHAVR